MSAGEVEDSRRVREDEGEEAPRILALVARHFRRSLCGTKPRANMRGEMGEDGGRRGRRRSAEKTAENEVLGCRKDRKQAGAHGHGHGHGHRRERRGELS